MKKFNKSLKIERYASSVFNFIKISSLACLLICMPHSATYAAAMSGTYTINASGSGTTNYTTFTLAASALTTNGVAGAVVFNVSAATFTESITIGAITGASAANTITFRGAGRTNT